MTRRSRIPPAVEARLGRIYWKAVALLFLAITLVCAWVASRIWIGMGGGGTEAWVGLGLVCAVGLAAGALALSARRKSRSGEQLPF